MTTYSTSVYTEYVGAGWTHTNGSTFHSTMVWVAVGNYVSLPRLAEASWHEYDHGGTSRGCSVNVVVSTTRQSVACPAGGPPAHPGVAYGHLLA